MRFTENGIVSELFLYTATTRDSKPFWRLNSSAIPRPVAPARPVLWTSQVALFEVTDCDKCYKGDAYLIVAPGSFVLQRSFVPVLQNSLMLPDCN